MKKSNVVMVLVMVLIVSPLMSSAFAGEISSQDITQTEDISISTAEAQTAPSVVELAFVGGGNGGDALLAGVVTFFIVLIVATAILSSGS